jgi:hypothetical protein
LDRFTDGQRHSHSPRSKGASRAAVALVALVAILGTSLLTLPSVSASSRPGLTGVGDANPATTPSFPTPIQHVFTIVLENAGLSQALSQGPYLSSLYNSYAGASKYYAVCHPSAPNYLALTSGERLQCGSDNVNSYAVSNIASLVTSAGESWNAYMESMPSPCYKQFYPPGGNGLYKPGHNPFIYYTDLASGGSNSACDTHDLPLSTFNPADTPANYTFLTPNMLNDGHNTSVAYASNWLSGYLPTLLAEPWAASTVFFVVYDEGEASDSSGYDGLDGGHTYLTAVSPYTLGSGLYTSDSSPYSLLTTIEWLLGLGSLGHNDNWTQFPPMKSMFQVKGPPTQYTLSGDVDSASSGQPIVGASVSAPGVPAATTNATGGYSLSLLNGTYQVTASAAGYQAGTTSITIDGKAAQHTFELTAASQPQYTLSGEVDSASTGQPVAGANVSAPGVPATFTNSSGGYSFSLLNGTYQVTASAPGFHTAASSITINGKAVHHTFELDAVSQAQYTLSGHIAFATNGSAVAGALVTVANVSAMITGPTGNFSFLLVNGSYVASASGPTFETVEEQVHVVGGPVTLNFNVTPVTTSSGFDLSGDVEYAANGSGVPGATVALAGGGSLSTSINGSYSFTLPNGTYSLTISQPGFYAQQAVVSVVGSSQTDDFELYPFLLLIQGAVLSQSSGAPLVGANVSLSPTIWQFSGLGGAYDFWVPNGTYTLRVDFQGYLSTDVALALHGEPVTTDLSLSASTVPTIAASPPPSPTSGTVVGGWTVAAIAAAAISFSALLGLAWRSKSQARWRGK